MNLFWNLDEIMHVNHSEYNVPKFSNSNIGTGATSLCWQESHWTLLHALGTLKPEDKCQWRQHVTFLVCACDSTQKLYLLVFWPGAGTVQIIHEFGWSMKFGLDLKVGKNDHLDPAQSSFILVSSQSKWKQRKEWKWDKGTSGGGCCSLGLLCQFIERHPAECGGGGSQWGGMQVWQGGSRKKLPRNT